MEEAAALNRQAVGGRMAFLNVFDDPRDIGKVRYRADRVG
jgi:hypothetical protein